MASLVAFHCDNLKNELRSYMSLVHTPLLRKEKKGKKRFLKNKLKKKLKRATNKKVL